MDILNQPTFSFKGKGYTTKPINVGALIDIEVMKGVITNNQYGTLVGHGTVLSNWNLDNIDMFSNLMVLCPDLMKDIKADSWRDLSVGDINELRDEYKKEFAPWLEKQLDFLTPKKVEPKKRESEKS